MTDLLKGINQTFLDENVLGLYNNQANLLRLYNELITEERPAYNKLDNLIKKSIYKYCFQRAMYNVGMNIDKTGDKQAEDVVKYIYPDTKDNEFIKNIYITFYDYLRILSLVLQYISSEGINFQDILRILNLNFTTMLNNNVIGYYCIMWLYLGSLLLEEQREKIFDITLENYNKIITDKNFEERERRIFLLSFLYSPFDYEIIYYYCENVNYIWNLFQDRGRRLTSIIMGSYLNDNIMKRENVNETHGCFFSDKKSDGFYNTGYLFLIPNRFQRMPENSKPLSYLLGLTFLVEGYDPNIQLFYAYYLLNEYYADGNFTYLSDQMQIEEESINNPMYKINSSDYRKDFTYKDISESFKDFYETYNENLILPFFDETCIDDIIETNFINEKDQQNPITIYHTTLSKYYQTVTKPEVSYKLLNTGFYFLKMGGRLEITKEKKVNMNSIDYFIEAIEKYYKSTSNMKKHIELLKKYTQNPQKVQEDFDLIET